MHSMLFFFSLGNGSTWTTSSGEEAGFGREEGQTRTGCIEVLL
jgi:hypothetical protein